MYAIMIVHGHPAIVSEHELVRYLTDARVTFSMKYEQIFIDVEDQFNGVWQHVGRYGLGTPPPSPLDEGSNPRSKSFTCPGCGQELSSPTNECLSCAIDRAVKDESYDLFAGAIPDHSATKDDYLRGATENGVPLTDEEIHYLYAWNDLDDDTKQAVLGQDISACPSTREIVRYMKEREDYLRRTAASPVDEQLLGEDGLGTYDMRNYVHPDWSEIGKEPLLMPETVMKLSMPDTRWLPRWTQGRDGLPLLQIPLTMESLTWAIEIVSKHTQMVPHFHDPVTGKLELPNDEFIACMDLFRLLGDLITVLDSSEPITWAHLKKYQIDLEVCDMPNDAGFFISAAVGKKGHLPRYIKC